MAKNTFLSFSTTPADNTDVGGVGIQGANLVSNFDDAFRTLMAILRGDIDNGTVFVTKSGAYTALAGDNNTFYEFTATATLSLTAAATLAADWHMMVFANGGAVTVDPNSTELINGAATLTIANGDAAYIICTGTAFKAVTIPSAASVALKADLLQPYVDVASATTTDIGAAASQNVRITGTTTITGLGTVAAGTVRDVLFSGVLTVTHNGTSLILQNGGSNIVTAAGDSMRFVSLGSGNWRQTDWQKATPSTIALATSQASTSGTSIDFTGIPAGVRRVTVMFKGVSTNGTSSIVIQVGSGSVQTSGYTGSMSAGSGASTYSASFIFALVAAVTVIDGTCMLSTPGSNVWVSNSSAGSAGNAVAIGAGGVTLGGAIDRVRVTTVSGADTFDAGSINISWEF